MTTRTPPGWPPQVPPPGGPGFIERATGWLLDVCPPDYRGHAVLRRHPAALAWLAARHVDAQVEATADALAAVRAELGDPATPGHLATGVVDELVEALQVEQARLLAVARAAALLAQALRGRRYVPRL